jgi:UDP-glucose 4-epimerase
MRKKILVTGGAGYIGSHVLNQIGKMNEYDVIIIDNLSTGRKENVLYGELVVGDIGNTAFLDWIFSHYEFDAVMHFAGSIIVPESVSDPIKYFHNNTENSLKVLKMCHKHQVNHFIFSSTAAVYGHLENGVASEDTPTRPINPYGRTKLMTEWMLSDYAQANKDFSYVVLRYFNVAGASLDGKIGQSTPQATHLLKAACEAAVGKRDHMSIFGEDYETRDGTGIRDFIHVDDLARAHVAALSYLFHGGISETLNCGYGLGHSVKEVIEETKKLSGVNFEVRKAPRRDGDCGMVMSQADKIREVLNWHPLHNDLSLIVKSALEWEKQL